MVAVLVAAVRNNVVRMAVVQVDVMMDYVVEIGLVLLR